VIGQTLSHYEITALLGKGGMGELYRANDTKLGREVALKILPRELSSDAERKARFEREARTLATLQHPNIASIYGFDEVDGVRFLTMELVEGEDLAQLLKRRRPPVEEALQIARQICVGLEAAHERGLVHRDLKPANVKIGSDGVVKILDFGLARAAASEATISGGLEDSPTISAAMTQAGVLLGTAAYMSPEQAKGRPVDKRADIWAFGVVLFEMLAGNKLFTGDSVSEVLAGVIKVEPDLEQLPADTPHAIRELIERCLDKRPGSRLRDIGEARVAIDRVLSGEDDRAAAAQGASSSRLPWIAAILLVAAITAFGGRLLAPKTPPAQLNKFLMGTNGDAPPHDMVISPDGRRIAYAQMDQLFVRELDELLPRELPTQGRVRALCWSPDGTEIAYLSGRAIWKMSAAGSGVQKIFESPERFSGGSGLDWGSNGRIVFATGDADIFDVAASGGDARVVIPLLENENDLHAPSCLPDGKGILFAAHRKDGASARRIETVIGGERRLIAEFEDTVNTPRYSAEGYVLFGRQGANPGIWAIPFDLDKMEATGEAFVVVADGIAASVANDGTLACLFGDLATTGQRAFVWVDRQGKFSEPVTQIATWFYAPLLAPDGTRMAVGEWDGHGEIWLHDLVRQSRMRLTFGNVNEVPAFWSADGEQLWCFAADTDSIWTQRIDGSEPPVFIAKGRSPSATPDEGTIIYEADSEAGDADLWTLRLDGDHEPESFLRTSASEGYPQISHDGNYVVYVSDESGRDEVYATRFPNGQGKWQISVDGGDYPRWQQDDGALYFQDADGVLFQVDVDLGASPRFGLPEKLIDPAEIGLSSGGGREYEVSADGSRVLWFHNLSVTKQSQDQGLVIIQNWSTEFARR